MTFLAPRRSRETEPNRLFLQMQRVWNAEVMQKLKPSHSPRVLLHLAPTLTLASLESAQADGCSLWAERRAQKQAATRQAWVASMMRTGMSVTSAGPRWLE